MKWLRTFWDRSLTDTCYRVVLHIGFWIFLLFFWMQESMVVKISLQQHISVTLSGIGFALFLFYPLVYLIVPLFQKRKWLWGILLFIPYYFLAVLLRSYHIEMIVNWYNLKQTWIVGRDFWPRFYNSQLNVVKLSVLFFSSLPSLLDIIYIPLTLKFIRYAYRFNLKQAWLAKENAQLQLNTLKAQINPHFFFNTLNNLQSFIVQNDKERSVDLLNKLAGFMRSSLYDRDEEYISMQQEITLLNNYIDIEKVRFDERADIRISLNDNDPAYRVPTFILLPFIENAFKHGGSLPTGEIAIFISLVNDMDTLLLTTENKFYRDEDTGCKGGIGLQNVRKRLDHYFPGNYTLDIEEKGQHYFTQLRISKK